MKGITKNPYKSDIFTVKQCGNKIKIAWCKTVREAGWEELEDKAPRGTRNDEKLSNNLARAKSTVQEYALCNPWDWWVTLTIDARKKDRYTLDEYSRDLREFIHNYNRRCSVEHKVKYVLIPERHKDGAWHMHGLIKGIRPNDIVVNSNGYKEWKQYRDKFGYISMEQIRDIEKTSSYMLKYMIKDVDRSVEELNKQSFYASQGLERAIEIYRGSGNLLTEWDWEHPDGFCKIKTIDIRNDSLYNHLEIFSYDDKASF